MTVNVGWPILPAAGFSRRSEREHAPGSRRKAAAGETTQCDILFPKSSLPKLCCGLYQGTTLVVPKRQESKGFSPCCFVYHSIPGAKALRLQSFSARLKSCPDTEHCLRLRGERAPQSSQNGPDWENYVQCCSVKSWPSPVAQAARLAESAVEPTLEGRDDSRPGRRGRLRHGLAGVSSLTEQYWNYVASARLPAPLRTRA